MGICDAARVSFKKEASQFPPEKNKGLLKYLHGHGHWSPYGQGRLEFEFYIGYKDLIHFFDNAILAGFKWKYGADGRIRMNASIWAWYENAKYLPVQVQLAGIQHYKKHFPWACEYLFGDSHQISDVKLITDETNPKLIHACIHGEAPIYVVRQLGKHQYGLTWNEVSRRYVDDPPEHYDIEEWRSRPEASIKQGSAGPLSAEDQDVIKCMVRSLREDSDDLYNNLLTNFNVAPEQARSILLQDMQTEWIWTGSLCDFKRICKDRLGLTAQKESRIFAEQVDAIMDAEFGEIWRGIK
jgi:thymidylate synthase (FAD)